MGSLGLGLAVLLQGCAGLAREADRPRAPRAVQLEQGSLEVRRGRPGFVIAAPHGTSDRDTHLIGRDLGRLTGWSAVVVTGFSQLDREGRRFNVNRPTESVPGTPARLETETEAARAVYETYSRLVAEAAQGSLRLYVEVHGNGHRDSAGRVEIATVGIALADAQRLKTLLERMRDARVTGSATPRLEVWVEALDPVRYTASAAKRAGMLGASERALHIELPKAARTTYRETYTAVLANFLTRSAPLLTGAP